MEERNLSTGRRPSARAALEQLERLVAVYEADTTPLKQELVEHLALAPLADGDAVFRLHEALCFLRAYPDNAELFQSVRAALDGFGQRSDLQRFHRALEDTGIAGTAINYRFFWPTARWLARHWPRKLHIDWQAWDRRQNLLDLLPHLLPYTESLTLDEIDRTEREWVDELRGDAGDAAFLLARIDALAGSEFTREKTYDLLDVALRLEPGTRTPARGQDVFPGAPVELQHGPLRRGRPHLDEDILRPPHSITPLSAARGRQLVDLARRAMVTRARDLDGFAHANPHDARWVDCGDGLAFGLLGLQPQRRLMLESSYAALTMKNGLPMGYVLVSALYGSAAIAYNVFETFRGAEAARVFGRVLAMARAVFGCDTFSIDPYQLGYGNAEGLASGAWWFYYKLGFRPRSRYVKGLLRDELRAMKQDRGHRSSTQTLEELASENMYFDAATPRNDIIGEIALGNIGLSVSHWLAHNYGSDRERAVRECSERSAEILGIDLRDRSANERLWWQRWSPLVCAIDAHTWSAKERRALAAVILAKGGRHESDFVPLFDAHPRLRAALLQLAQE
jgi:hypothetical protein